MKEGDFDRALEKFDAAMKIMGYQAELAYNVALCYYRMKQYAHPPLTLTLLLCTLNHLHQVRPCHEEHRRNHREGRARAP